MNRFLEKKKEKKEPQEENEHKRLRRLVTQFLNAKTFRRHK